MSRGRVDGRPASDGRALELRREFDRSFAAAPPGEAEDCEDLLTVRVAGEPYALRMREIAGIEPCRGIVPVPSRVPELLGLSGIRGGLVAVYGLAALLGHAGAREAIRWLVLCGGTDMVGLGLAQLEGWLGVPRSELCLAAPGEVPGPQAREVVRAGGILRAVISIPSALETLKARVESAVPPKET